MSRRRFRCTGGLVMLSVGLGASAATGQMAWDAPNDCAPASPSRLEPVAAVPALEVVIRESEGRWSAVLTARYPAGRTGVRQFSAASCSELQRAVGVAVSLLRDGESSEAPLGLREDSLAEPAAAGDVSTAVAPPLDNEAAETRAAETRKGVSVSVAAAAEPALVALTTPEPMAQPTSLDRAPVTGSDEGDAVAEGVGGAEHRAGPIRLHLASVVALQGTDFAEWGGALGVSVWLGQWGGRLQFEGRLPFEQVKAEHQIAIELERIQVGLGLCTRTRSSPNTGLCAGARVERWGGIAQGTSDPRADSIWLPAVGGGASLGLPLTPNWAITAELQSHWRLRRAVVDIDPWGVVYELPRFDLALLAGAEWAP